jgi:hypothetical protein
MDAQVTMVVAKPSHGHPLIHDDWIMLLGVPPNGFKYLITSYGSKTSQKSYIWLVVYLPL